MFRKCVLFKRLLGHLVSETIYIHRETILSFILSDFEARSITFKGRIEVISVWKQGTEECIKS